MWSKWHKIHLGFQCEHIYTTIIVGVNFPRKELTQSVYHKHWLHQVMHWLELYMMYVAILIPNTKSIDFVSESIKFQRSAAIKCRNIIFTYQGLCTKPYATSSYCLTIMLLSRKHYESNILLHHHLARAILLSCHLSFDPKWAPQSLLPRTLVWIQ